MADIITPARETWICEFCGEPHDGKDPPDRCNICQGTQFENGEDLIRDALTKPESELD